MLLSKYYNYYSLINYLKVLFISYLIIGITLLHPENGDEGFYLRIISELINGRTFLSDFATNMPVIIMYLFYPLKFVTSNYYIGGKFLIGLINLISFLILYYFLKKNNKNIEYKYIVIFFFLIFISSNNLFYYSFQIRQWPIIYLLQICLVSTFYFYFNFKRKIYIFLLGIIIGLLLSSRQTYILFFPVTLFILCIEDILQSKSFKLDFRKYFLFVLGFCLSFSIYFNILLYDFNFALGLWYFLNQDIHFSNQAFNLKNIIFDFFGFNEENNYISILVFSTVILYLYLIIELIKKFNIFRFFIFSVSTLIIGVTFFGWSHGYHKEAFLILFVYFFLSLNKNKNALFRFLSIFLFLIILYNTFLINNSILKKNTFFIKDSLVNLIKFKFHKVELYNSLNHELKKYCSNSKLTWDTRRGRLLSSNSNCKYHPKIVNQYLTTGILTRNIYDPKILDKIYKITLKPDQLIYFLINEVDLIIANDIDDLLNEMLLIIKRNSLDIQIFDFLCDKNCIIDEDREVNLIYFQNALRNLISKKFKTKRVLDFTFFLRI